MACGVSRVGLPLFVIMSSDGRAIDTAQTPERPQGMKGVGLDLMKWGTDQRNADGDIVVRNGAV